MFLLVEAVDFYYEKTPVLEQISFGVPNGSIMGLLGPNGAGKTTLLKCIAGLYPVKAGKVMMANENLQEMSAAARAHFIGYVPQSTQAGTSARVIDLVMMGRIPYLRFSPKADDRQIVFSVLERLQLNELAFREFNRLSGGEKQRVLLARAMAQEPKLLLLDEPTSNLDMKYQLETIRLIRGYTDENKIAVVVSIHDLNLASMLCDQVLLLKKGRCFAQGDCYHVLTSENIRGVYDVDVEIWEKNGRKQVLFAT